MTENNLRKRSIIFLLVFSMVFLLSSPAALSQNKDSLEKKLTRCLALLEKNPEVDIADELLNFLSLQNDYVASKFTDELKQIVRKNPSTVFAHYQLGFIYAKDIVKYEKAVTEFNQSLSICRQRSKKLSPYIPFINYRLASLWLANGQYQEAFDLLEPLKKDLDFPYRAQLYNKSGVSCYYLDRLYKAVDNFKTALIIDSKYAEAKYNLKSLNLKLEHFNAGRVYLRMQQYMDAETEFAKALEQSPNFVMAHHFMGLACAYQNKWDQAIKEYNKTIALAPHYELIHEVHNLLGNAYIRQALNTEEIQEIKVNYLKKGINELKTSLSLRPEFSEARKNLRSIYQTQDLVTLMGISHMEAGDEYLKTELFEKAVDEFNKVLKKDPENKHAFRQQVKTIVDWARYNSCRKKNYDQAITICKRYLHDVSTQKTKDILTLFLGYAYLQKGELWYDKAMEELKKIPFKPQVNYYLGLIYFNQGQLTNALDEFQQAKNSDLDNPEYFFLLAKLHFYLRNQKLAKRLLQKALEKIESQLEKTKSDSLQLSHLCERKGIYEQDLMFIQQQHTNAETLPSDQEKIGLLINSGSLKQEASRSLYGYIERKLERQTGLAVVGYKRYADLVAKKHIEEGCTTIECLDKYSWLIDTPRLLLVDLEQWGDRLLVAFSLFHPETEYKESIYEQEFKGLDLYDSIEQSIEGVSKYFKTQRTKIYCEICPEI